MLKGFKEFLLRGNIVDLAVAVVIGTAFVALPMRKLMERFTTPAEDVAVAVDENTILLREIRDALAARRRDTPPPVG